MNSNVNWVLQIDPNIYKTLKRMPRKDTERILNTIQNLSSSLFTGDVQKMKGEKNVWRRRVGSYRIFYELILKPKIIYVFWVERRSSKTYRK